MIAIFCNSTQTKWLSLESVELGDAVLLAGAGMFLWYWGPRHAC